MTAPAPLDVHPPAVRAAVYAAFGLLLLAIAGAWLTDGYKTFPDLSHFSRWAERHE